MEQNGQRSKGARGKENPRGPLCDRSLAEIREVSPR